ncbi:hypothetical protein Tco_0032855 [Tanacetum coccineum]
MLRGRRHGREAGRGGLELVVGLMDQVGGYMFAIGGDGGVVVRGRGSLSGGVNIAPSAGFKQRCSITLQLGRSECLCFQWFDLCFIVGIITPLFEGLIVGREGLGDPAGGGFDVSDEGREGGHIGEDVVGRGGRGFGIGLFFMGGGLKLRCRGTLGCFGALMVVLVESWGIVDNYMEMGFGLVLCGWGGLRNG